MQKRYFKIITVLILLPVLLLQGCWLPPRPNAPTVSSLQPPAHQDPPPPPEDIPQDAHPVPGQFTLRYEPGYTMNPIIASNRDNIVLASLMYESLFVLNDDLVAMPILCTNWESEDNLIFTIEVMPNIEMHDGSMLTADDVAYSIRQAMNHSRSRFRHKLHGIESVTSDGELIVTISLETPNVRFVRLLDIPIIKSGSMDERIPPGTGPYLFAHEDAMRLSRFIKHRHIDELPLISINLLECSDGDLTQLFDSGELSLLWDDPTGAFDIRFTRPHEPRFFNTTAMQFLGFNANSPALRNNDVRRAIGCAIDRQYIVENIMNVPRSGQAVAAPVAISPVFDMYDPQWEQRGDLLSEMGVLVQRAGLEDYYNESFLAMPDGMGGFLRFTLDFIVNIENSHKREAARRIADSLRQFGFNVVVRELQWSDFMNDLNGGRFDLFYGEVLLGADFDFTPLLIPGEDSINFGNTASAVYKPLIQSFLAASTPEEVSFAGEQLNLAITQMAPFVPILYKRHAIYTHMGTISRATPSQSGVFHNFQDWSIDLLRLN